jgi:hypothetical protein
MAVLPGYDAESDPLLPPCCPANAIAVIKSRIKNLYLSDSGGDPRFNKAEFIAAENKIDFPTKPELNKFRVAGTDGCAAGYVMRLAFLNDFFTLFADKGIF